MKRRLGSSMLSRSLIWWCLHGCAETPRHPVEDAAVDAAVLDARVRSADSGSADALDAEMSDRAPDSSTRDHTSADSAVADQSALLYPREVPLQIELTVAPADWERLRNEGRSQGDIYTGCIDLSFAYTIVPAQLRVNGQELTQVGIRNRGLIGSLSTLKPSLRIDTQELGGNQTVYGEKTITLVNSRTDPSLARSCLAYAQFQAAGIESPRCGFARVTVNGSYLGTYLSVEPVKKPFLRRRFGDDDGDLYEATAGDFRTDRLQLLEKKTNEQTPPGPELAALAAALDKPDAELEAALAPLLDLPAFLRFWATEVLIGNDDGYSGNANNYFVYVKPQDGKLAFIPWGPDGAFLPTPVDTEQTRPKSVMAKGKLARRLYAYAPTREQYRQTLRSLLAQHWNESALLAELDRIEEVVGMDADAPALERVRTFIRTRRQELLAELDGPAPVWPYPEPPAVVCRPELIKPIRGRFDTVWGTASAPGLGLGENVIELDLGSGPVVQTILPLLANAVPADDGAQSGMWRWAIGLTSVQLDGSLLTLQLISWLPAPPAGTIRFHGFETFGELLQGPADKLRSIARVGNGSITIDQAPSKPGDRVRGHFEGELVLLTNKF